MSEPHSEPRRHTAVLCSVLQQSKSQEYDVILYNMKGSARLERQGIADQQGSCKADMVFRSLNMKHDHCLN